MKKFKKNPANILMIVNIVFYIGMTLALIYLQVEKDRIANIQAIYHILGNVFVPIVVILGIITMFFIDYTSFKSKK